MSKTAFFKSTERDFYTLGNRDLRRGSCLREIYGDEVHIYLICGYILLYAGLVTNLTRKSGVAYTDIGDLDATVGDFFVEPLNEGATQITRTLHIDSNRTDTYTANGSATYPFKSFHEAASAMVVGQSYVVHVAPGNYAEEDISFPACPITIYGNKAILICTSATINAPYAIFDLNTTGNVIYAYTGATRSMRIGGSIVGDVSVSGFEDYESVNFSAHTITVQAGSNPLFSHCTFGSKLISGAATSAITINDCSFDRINVDDYNIDMALGGTLICKGALLYNKAYANGGTRVNINLSGASTTTPSLLSGCICGNGIAAGTAYVIVGDDNIAPVLTGSKIIPIKSPVCAFGVGGGTAQAQTATVPMVAYGYVAGMEISYIPSVTNTGAAATVNVNALGAKTILRGNSCGLGTALLAGDILLGIPAKLQYDGTNFRLLNPQASFSDNSASGYIDIGSVRIQWGSKPGNGVATDTVTLPVAFASTTYTTSLTPFTVTNALLGFNTVTKSVGNFTVRKKSGSGDSMAEGFDWIAIGVKP